MCELKNKEAKINVSRENTIVTNLLYIWWREIRQNNTVISPSSVLNSCISIMFCCAKEIAEMNKKNKNLIPFYLFLLGERADKVAILVFHG